MLKPDSGNPRPRVLIIDDELSKLEMALGRAVENIATALEGRNIEVLRSISFEDGQAIVVSDASLRAVLLDWNLGMNTEGTHAQATVLLHKLRERQAATPVFVLYEPGQTGSRPPLEPARPGRQMTAEPEPPRRTARPGSG